MINLYFKEFIECVFDQSKIESDTEVLNLYFGGVAKIDHTASCFCSPCQDPEVDLRLDRSWVVRHQ